MQTVLFVGLTMACTGLAGTSGASVNATVSGDLATVTDQGTPDPAWPLVLRQ
jgi:hypothetical protein